MRVHNYAVMLRFVVVLIICSICNIILYMHTEGQNINFLIESCVLFIIVLVHHLFNLHNNYYNRLLRVTVSCPMAHTRAIKLYL